jgi:dihydrofolate synthase/folylpolyglutamate synthase
MNYPDAIDYLHSLTDYEKTRIERYAPDTLNLTRVERLLAALGDPHADFAIVHIAGTKGKGSTAALVEAGLRAAGYRTGLYTSPHLHTFRERIRVAGEMIPREDVVSLVGEIQTLIERIPDVTTFEAITAIGFLYFARQAVEIAVVEVGLGGRLDATNVVTPEVSVITSLSLDHTYLLGDTLAEIAYEKAGIIKPGVPVVLAPQKAEARQVIETVSEERHAALTEIGRDWTYTPGQTDLDGQAFTVARATGPASTLSGTYWIPLLGHHQLENAATAVATLDVLRQRGFEVATETVHDGLRQARWPGRMEILSRDPLVVTDCAHNPYSAQVLADALREWFPERRWTLIFGASADKDIAGVLEALLPISSYVIVTRSDHPRALAPVKLADIVADLGDGAEISVGVEKALQHGLAAASPHDGVLVTGSIFLVADAIEAWAEHVDAPKPENDDV